jgi:hypothetical protein
MFGTSGSSKSQKSRFSMSGALAQGDQNGEVSSEPESDADQQKTPSKDASSRKARTPRTKADEGKNTKSNGVVKQTWSQWLSSILPKSLARSESPEAEKKNIPKTPRRENDSDNDETESNYSTPFQTPRGTFGNDNLDMPGSYEKPTAPAPKGDNFVNPNFLNNDSRRTPVRGPGGFNYNPQSPYDLPSPTDSSPASSVASQTPQRSPQKKGSRSSLMAPTSARRMPPTPGAASYRKPSNFIERMRSAKQKRYDPYSRPSAAHRRAPGYSTITYEEFPKDMSPEEELEFLERRAKDRKVQEAEDRYLRRLTLKRLGRPVEDEEMSDPDTPPRGDKGKQLAIEDGQDLDGDSIISDRGGSTTPPDSPPQTPSLFNKSAGVPLFQFQPIAPKPPGSPEKLQNSPPGQPLFGDSDNDWEPPPPPVMSHRELPGPAQPASVPSLGGGLFGDKQPVGGFGISEAPSPVAKLRFDKFKPRVSSGLRESSTIEKENERLANNNKENSSTSDDYDYNSGSKGGKTVFGQQSTNKNQVSSSGALRELGKNSPVGMGIKIDVRSKLAAVCSPSTIRRSLGLLLDHDADGNIQLPVKDLSHIAAWPMQLELFSKGIDQEVQSCARDMFNSTCKESWMSDWASNVFGDASAMVERL